MLIIIQTDYDALVARETTHGHDVLFNSDLNWSNSRFEPINHKYLSKTQLLGHSKNAKIYVYYIGGKCHRSIYSI